MRACGVSKHAVRCVQVRPLRGWILGVVMSTHAGRQGSAIKKQQRSAMTATSKRVPYGAGVCAGTSGTHEQGCRDNRIMQGLGVGPVLQLPAWAC